LEKEQWCCRDDVMRFETPAMRSGFIAQTI
jgi:hypothetical protein